MAKRQFQLTDEERQAFEQAERQTRDTYELKRLQAVRLYGSGIATQVIKQLVGCSDRRLREWTQKFQQSGYELLVDQATGILLRYAAYIISEEYATATVEHLQINEPIASRIFDPVQQDPIW